MLASAPVPILFETKTGCKEGDTCLFPYHKFDEEQNERLKRGHFPKRRESEDKGVVAIVKSVSQLGCVSEDSNAIRKVRFTKSTLRQASIREKRGQSLGKNKSFLVSEVRTLQNSRIGPTKRLDDNSYVPKARLGMLPKIYTSSKRTTGLHSSHSQRSGFS